MPGANEISDKEIMDAEVLPAETKALIEVSDLSRTSEEIFAYVKDTLVAKATPLKERAMDLHRQVTEGLPKKWEGWDLEAVEFASQLYDAIAAHEKIVRGKGTELDMIRDKAEKLKKGILRALDDIMAGIPEDQEALKEKIRLWRKRETDRAAEEARLKDIEAKKAEEDLRLKEAQDAEDAGDKEVAKAILEEPVYVAPTPIKANIPQGGPKKQTFWKYNERELDNVMSPEFLKLPNKYKMPNHKMIGAIVRSQRNLTDIPGVKVREE